MDNKVGNKQTVAEEWGPISRMILSGVDCHFPILYIFVTQILRGAGYWDEEASTFKHSGVVLLERGYYLASMEEKVGKLTLEQVFVLATMEDASVAKGVDEEVIRFVIDLKNSKEE